LIFKKTIELEKFVEINVPSSLVFGQQDSCINQQDNEILDELAKTIENKNILDEKTFLKQFKTLLGKFRFTIAHLGHYIHYFNVANSSSKRYGMREADSPTSSAFMMENVM
jgi:hypothetical protein